MNIISFVCIFFIILPASCTITSDTEHGGAYPVFGLEPLRDVSASDLPDKALVIWARKSSWRNLTVVHMSMQSGLAPLSAEKTERLKSLVKKGHWEELERSLDQGDNSLVTPQNYLTAAVSLGIIGRIFWVVPDTLMEYADAERRTRQFLENSAPYFTRKELNDMRYYRGCVSGRLRDLPVSVCGPETFPAVEEPVLLDMDITFLMQYANMKHASPLRGFKMIYDALAIRKLRVASAGITASDMRSRSMYHYLGEQASDALREPSIMKSDSAPDVWLSRDAVAWAFAQGDDMGPALKTALDTYPADRPLVLFGAADEAFRGREARALETLAMVCASDRTGCAALLYVGGELKKKQRYAVTELFLQKALALRPDWPDALREYGDLLYEKKDYLNALQRYQALAAIADGASVQFAIGDCLTFLGRKHDALDHYTKGLAFSAASASRRLSGRDRESLVRLIQLLEEQKDAERAETVRRLLAPPPGTGK